MALSAEHALTQARVSPTVQNQTRVRIENCHIENYRRNEENVIAQKAKWQFKDMFVNELLTMVKESLDDFLRMSVHSGLNGIRSVLYEVVIQHVQDLLLRDVTGEWLDAHITDLRKLVHRPRVC